LSLQEKLKSCGYKVQRLDGDVLRETLCRDLGFSKEDRKKNVERAMYVAQMLNENGIITLVSLISPYREMRNTARQYISNFIEVYVKCPLEVCIERDVKGLYKKALAGEIKDFTGVSDPYEEPLNPDVVVDTSLDSIEHCTELIFESLMKRLGH
jgi:adenylylsulfate kinase